MCIRDRKNICQAVKKEKDIKFLLTREKKGVELIDIKKSNINYFLITFIEIEDFKSSTETN